MAHLISWPRCWLNQGGYQLFMGDMTWYTYIYIIYIYIYIYMYITIYIYIYIIYCTMVCFFGGEGATRKILGFQKIQRELLGSSGIEWEILWWILPCWSFFCGETQCHMPTIWGLLKSIETASIAMASLGWWHWQLGCSSGAIFRKELWDSEFLKPHKLAYGAHLTMVL